MALFMFDEELARFSSRSMFLSNLNSLCFNLNTQLNSTLEKRVSELAQIQADEHQVYLQSALLIFLIEVNSVQSLGKYYSPAYKDDRPKFIWEEVLYLERWWSDASDAKR
ncbi:hypothetical protein L6452_10075 [Arctium lappa]|uniref:Uncharacterized protein n=1 Tax=Arctium lappa TaxID=4217 RepID=A0ACB9DM47_ARCLA|nr:hypothetical protein L6452_10075 [Arctium lappa]